MRSLGFWNIWGSGFKQVTNSTQTGIKKFCIVLVIQWPLCSAFTAHSEMTQLVKLEILHFFVVIYTHLKFAWVCIAGALCFCSSKMEFISVLGVKVLKLWWKQIAEIRRSFDLTLAAIMWANISDWGETPCIPVDMEWAGSWEACWNWVPCDSSAMVLLSAEKEF